jgi:hypothetical protein
MRERLQTVLFLLVLIGGTASVTTLVAYAQFMQWGWIKHSEPAKKKGEK